MTQELEFEALGLHWATNTLWSDTTPAGPKTYGLVSQQADGTKTWVIANNDPDCRFLISAKQMGFLLESLRSSFSLRAIDRAGLGFPVGVVGRLPSFPKKASSSEPKHFHWVRTIPQLPESHGSSKELPVDSLAGPSIRRSAIPARLLSSRVLHLLSRIKMVERLAAAVMVAAKRPASDAHAEVSA